MQKCKTKENWIKTLNVQIRVTAIQVVLKIRMGPWNITQIQWQTLKKALSSLARTTIKKESSSYIHAVCKSAVFGFPDDVEFSYDKKSSQLNYRSKSRVGKYDFGVNKKRILELKSQIL